VAVADPRGQGEGILVRGASLPGPAGRLQCLAISVERSGLAGLVADLVEDRGSLAVALGGLLITTLRPFDDTDVAERAGLAEPVSDLAEDREGLP